jgi:hypothetical protein
MYSATGYPARFSKSNRPKPSALPLSDVLLDAPIYVAESDHAYYHRRHYPFSCQAVPTLNYYRPNLLHLAQPAAMRRSCVRAIVILKDMKMLRCM